MQGKKLILILLLFLAPMFTGCAGVNSFLESAAQNQGQQLMIKTTIQLSTATYIDKNSGSEEIILEVTDKIMQYLTEDVIYEKTTAELQVQMHKLIGGLELSVGQKIALTSLADLILAEAVNWAKIGLDDKITETHANALFFCANAMNETAKLYVIPESKGRSYSVNAVTE